MMPFKSEQAIHTIEPWIALSRKTVTHDWKSLKCLVSGYWQTGRDIVQAVARGGWKHTGMTPVQDPRTSIDYGKTIIVCVLFIVCFSSLYGFILFSVLFPFCNANYFPINFNKISHSHVCNGQLYWTTNRVQGSCPEMVLYVSGLEKHRKWNFIVSWE